MPSFCGDCGRVVEDEHTFCSGCGRESSPQPPLAETPGGDSDEPLFPAVRDRWPLMAAGIVLVAAMGGCGVAVAQHTLQGSGPGTPTSSRAMQGSESSASSPSTNAPPTPSTSAPASPSVAVPVIGRAEPGLPSGLHDVAGVASIDAPPSTRAPVDSGGQRATYPARAMLDGVAATAWRMDGDGAGKDITLTFAIEQQVAGIALDPGFDEVDAEQDHWAESRRVIAATFTMEGGEAFSVTFSTAASLPVRQRLQSFALPAPVTTSTVVMHIDATTAARRGDRDTTALSRFAVLVH